MGGKFKLYLKKIKLHTWQLILILIPLLFLAATFLRLDHIKMTELRTVVLDADAAGDEEKLSNSLSELANFTRKNIVINIIDNNGDKKLLLAQVLSILNSLIFVLLTVLFPRPKRKLPTAPIRMVISLLPL